MIDLKNPIAPVESLAPAARTTSVSGAIADLRGYNAVLVVIHAGNWTDGSHAFEIRDGDDITTFTAVDDAYLIGTEPTVTSDANDDLIYHIGYIGVRRYLRVVCTITGAPITGLVAGVVILRGVPSIA